MKKNTNNTNLKKIKITERFTVTVNSYISRRNQANCQFKYRLSTNNYKYMYNQFETLTSSDEPIVYLHEDFVHGSQNADLDKSKLIDYPNMQQPEIDLLNDFFQKIFNNQPLEGTNKPSDSHENGNVYEPLLTGYYHYHCGSYTKNNGVYKNKLSEMNWKGSKSGPAIHYLKYNENGQDIFIIVAFVISHGKEPGNPMDDTFKEKNKIIEQTKFQDETIF